MERNVDDMNQQHSVVRAESSENQVTLHRIVEDLDNQCNKLSEQNEAGETRRQALEKKVRGWVKSRRIGPAAQWEKRRGNYGNGRNGNWECVDSRNRGRRRNPKMQTR